MSKWIATPEAQRRVGCTYYAIKAAAAVGKVRIELGKAGRVCRVWEADLSNITERDVSQVAYKNSKLVAKRPQEAIDMLTALRQMSRPVGEKVSGVYFLFDGDDLVYIGQSVNVHKRVSSHIGSQKFTRYAFLPCHPIKLLEEEARMVRILKPKNNVFAQWAGYLNVEAELKASTLFGMMDDLMGIRRWPIKHAPGLLSQL